MKAKVFLNNKLLTKVNINNTNEIPKIGSTFQWDKKSLYVHEVLTFCKPKFTVEIILKECSFTELG